MITEEEIEKILLRARIFCYKASSSIEETEHHMKSLFTIPEPTLEMVLFYNRLERRWKVLTHWRDTEKNLIHVSKKLN